MKITIAKCLKSMRGFLLRNIRFGIAKCKEMGRLLLQSRLIYKICLLNMLIAVVSTGVFGFYIYFNTFHRTREQIVNNARQNREESVKDIETIMKRIETQAANLQLNDVFLECVNGLGQKTPAQVYDSYSKLDKMCVDAENVDNSYTVSLIFSRRYMMMDNRDRFFFDESEGIKEPAQGSQFWAWEKGEKEGKLSYGVCIKTKDGENVLLLFTIREKVYGEWMEYLHTYGGKDSFLGMQEVSGRKYNGLEADIMDLIIQEGRDSGEFDIKYEGAQYFTLYKQISGSPFYTIFVFPKETIEKLAEDSVRGMFFILIPIFMLVVAFSYIASVHITRHLRRLTQEMNRMYSGEENGKASRGKDEINILEKAFHELQGRIQKVMEEMEGAKKKQIAAELGLLQAQINPHFLYNTLDSINWLAIEMNVPQISFIVRNMSDYFRIGLNAGQQVTTLKQELCHIISYFNIQKFRYEGRIHLYVNIPEEMMESRMIVLTLQPLVENAILHGILVDEKRNGEIIVSGEVVDGNMVIYVSDDGVGMGDEQVDELNRKIKKGGGSEQNGFGLYNVNQRIRYYYGEEYGLDIISSPGEGTTCILTLRNTQSFFNK